MAFPLIALLGSALSDMGRQKESRDSGEQSYWDTLQKIDRTRAQQLGAQPYSFIADDYMNGVQKRHLADAEGSNNGIGSILQAYAMQGLGGGGEKFGDDYESSFLKQPNLQYNASEDGIGLGDAMGKAQVDPWDKDPWGDAGF